LILQAELLSKLILKIKIPMAFAHANFVKAIAYTKVKTDKVDSHTLAHLLLNFQI
jgi:hypothetical protein